MDKTPETQERELNAMGTKDLRQELWIILPIFVISACMFVGSFQYRFEAASVPMFVGAIAVLLSGMRFFHILFPRSRIGAFKEESLGSEFDSLKKKIEDDLQVVEEEGPAAQITFRKEKKAFIGLFGCFVAFFLFGYLVGTFLVVVGASYYYGFKKKGPILISLVTMYVIVYVTLYKIMGAPSYYGLVGRMLKPVLKSLHMI